MALNLMVSAPTWNCHPVTGDELTDLLVSASGHVLVLAVLGIDECDRALVEVDEPVAEGLLEDQQGMVVDQGVNVVAEQPVAADRPELLKALPGALGHCRYQVVAGYHMLLKIHSVLRAHLASVAERAEAQRPLVRFLQLGQRLDDHGGDSCCAGSQGDKRPERRQMKTIRADQYAASEGMATACLLRTSRAGPSYRRRLQHSRLGTDDNVTADLSLESSSSV
jgi:hypothetical protein